MNMVPNITERVVAFVPIRTNSKRIKNKNFKIIAGRKLLTYVLDTLANTDLIDMVYVFCSDEKIKKYCHGKVTFLKRPPLLDGDDVLGIDIYKSFVSSVDSDIYILAHATSPFTKVESLETSINKIKYEGYDSAFSALEQRTFAWYKGKPLNYNPENVVRTQDIEPVYIETSGFFMFKKDVLLKHGRRIGFHPYMHIVDNIEGIDIDYPDDLILAKKIAEGSGSNL